jgi:hypothetical protein
LSKVVFGVFVSRHEVFRLLLDNFGDFIHVVGVCMRTSRDFSKSLLAKANYFRLLVDAVRLHLSRRRELRSVLSEEVLACNFLDRRAEVGHVRELHVVHDIVSSLGTLVQEQFVLSHHLLAALRVFDVLLAQVQRQRPDFRQL